MEASLSPKRGKMFHRIFILLLIISCTSVNSSRSIARFGRKSSMQNFSEKYKEKFSKKYFKKMSPSAFKSSYKGVQNAALHSAQTWMFIQAMIAAKVIKHEIHVNKLEGEDNDWSEITERVTQECYYALEGGGVWASMMGSTLSHLMIEKGANALNKSIQKTAMQNLFKKFLIGSVSSFVGFVGWEMVGQLWDQARYMIEDKDVFLASEKAASIFSNFIRGGELTESERKVFSAMIGNMGEILFVNKELRQIWLSNTWRYRLKTGEFAMIIESITVGSLVGSKMIPGKNLAYKILGGVLGAGIGAGLLVFAPKHISEGVTRFAKWTTLESAKNDHRNSFSSLQGYTFSLLKRKDQESFSEINYQSILNKIEDQLLSHGSRTAAILDVINYNYNLQNSCRLDLEILSKKREICTRNPDKVSEDSKQCFTEYDRKTEKKCIDENKKANKYIQRYFSFLSETYSDWLKGHDKLKLDEIEHHPKVVKMIKSYSKLIKKMQEWVDEFEGTFNDDLIDPSKNHAHIFLNFTTIWGYNEKTALSTWNDLSY